MLMDWGERFHSHPPLHCASCGASALAGCRNPKQLDQLLHSYAQSLEHEGRQGFWLWIGQHMPDLPQTPCLRKFPHSQESCPEKQNKKEGRSSKCYLLAYSFKYRKQEIKLKSITFH